MIYSAPLKHLLKIGSEVLTTTAQTLSAAVNELKADLNNLSTVARTGRYIDLVDIPTFATVATSGSYSDLSGLPTLGTAAAKDVPSSGNAGNTEVVLGNDTRLTNARTPTAHTHTKSQITDFPTIPTVNNATLTIKQAGTSKGTFTANASSNATIELTDTNTWRPVQNNLTSTSTTDCLSAAQGKALNDNKLNKSNGLYVKDFSKTFGSKISGNSLGSIEFTNLNVSGYTPLLAFYRSNSSNNRIVPARPCQKVDSDGTATFGVLNTTSNEYTPTVYISVLYVKS